MKKILVIGASGSLGTGILNELKDKYKITGTFLNSEIKIDDVKKVRVDITDAQSFEQLEVDFDAVLLIAGAMPAEMRGYNPLKYIDVNITGTLNVLEYCRKNSINKLIYIMSFSDVAGSFYNGIPIKEDAPRTLNYIGDHAVYAISKVTASELIEHYHQEYDLQTIIFRIPTVYCNDDNINYYVDGEQKVKAYIQMIRSVVQDKRIEVWGNPDHAKDMPYIKDFARLIGKAVLSKNAQGLYNCGSGNPVTLDKFVDAVINVFSNASEVEKVYCPEKPSQPNFTFDMSKTEKEFDFKPEYDIQKMLLEMKEALKSSDVLSKEKL